MFLAFDTYYYDNKAKTVCIQFNNWTDNEPSETYIEVLEGVAEYVPGEFFRREMPCILSLLKTIQLENLEAIIVDGFVVLDDNNKLGLGGHLYESLNAQYPIIGVAKSNFAQIEKNKRAVFRGESQKPLYVTAIGTDIDEAAENVKNMSGKFRFPDLLKLLDTLTKEK
ncbi:MAG: endonuclease V [Prevotella sp.]|jgi:exodeoxyribonuclease-5/deoxyribonuclease V|nr:endonuclease V [Prevotella sp.]